MIFLTTYPAHVTLDDIILNLVVWGIVILLFLGRKKSKLNARLWNFVATFFGLLLLLLGVNYTKKKVKDWWNKD